MLYKNYALLDETALPEELKSFLIDTSSQKAYRDFLNEQSPYTFIGLKGFFNIKTKQMLLGPFTSHEALAEDKKLILNDKQVKPNWYGFDINYGQEPGAIYVSPMSGKYGAMPISAHTLFDTVNKALFTHKFPIIKYYQFNYKRHISQDILIAKIKDSTILVTEVSPDENFKGNPPASNTLRSAKHTRKKLWSWFQSLF